MSFKITLSPVASDHDTSISVDGSVLTYDGVDYDFSALTTGSQVEAVSPAIGLIENKSGVINITLEYHYESATAESNQSTDINDYIVTASSGAIADVIARNEVE